MGLSKSKLANKEPHICSVYSVESQEPREEICATFNFCQRSFSLQWVVVNEETHNWSKC